MLGPRSAGLNHAFHVRLGLQPIVQFAAGDETTALRAEICRLRDHAPPFLFLGCRLRPGCRNGLRIRLRDIRPFARDAWAGGWLALLLKAALMA